jgi:hypothetical protein
LRIPVVGLLVRQQRDGMAPMMTVLRYLLLVVAGICFVALMIFGLSMGYGSVLS